MASRAAQARAPHFTQPVRQITVMLVVLGLVGAGAAALWDGALAEVFRANPYLNGTIVLVFVVGVLACFWQLAQLFAAVGFIERVAASEGQADMVGAPRILAPLAALLRGRGARMQISSSSARTILDSVGARMEEARDITRYIANLLIFLGLLGTFYGLATTVPAVVDTIRSLSPGEGEDSLGVFGRLMDGLEDQLGGMGVAFASSLLGLAGSLIVGLLELFAGHGQNRFYREMEEWLSTITRLGVSGGDGDGGSIDQGALATVLDHMVDQVDSLQDLFARSEVRRGETDERVAQLTTAMSDLTRRLGEDGTGTLDTLKEGQERLIAAMEARAEGGGEGIDPESRMRLRSIDVQLLKIFEEMAAGREDALVALRGDLAQLTTAIQDLARSGPAPASTPTPPASPTPIRRSGRRE